MSQGFGPILLNSSFFPDCSAHSDAGNQTFQQLVPGPGVAVGGGGGMENPEARPVGGLIKILDLFGHGRVRASRPGPAKGNHFRLPEFQSVATTCCFCLGLDISCSTLSVGVLACLCRSSHPHQPTMPINQARSIGRHTTRLAQWGAVQDLSAAIST